MKAILYSPNHRPRRGSRRSSSRFLRTGTSRASKYLGTVVERTQPGPAIHMTLHNGNTTVDPYVGLDRFGRVIDLLWEKTATGTTDLEHFTYGAIGNRLFRTNLVGRMTPLLWSVHANASDSLSNFIPLPRRSPLQIRRLVRKA